MERPTKRFECQRCKSLINIPVQENENKIKCCANPDLKLIYAEHEGDPRIEMGKAYEDIIKLINNYMDLPEEYAKLLSLWIIGTYFHSAFNTFPFLFINAMRGSGKTRLLRMISHLAKGGQGRVQTGITEATLFRMPKGETLILDELESIGGRDKQALREYMNASYKRGGVVARNKKIRVKNQETWAIDYFEPYKPIAMANIWGMDEVLGDRCLNIVLEKSNNPAKTKMTEDFETNPKFKQLNELLNVVSVVSVYVVSPGNITSKWNDWVYNTYNTDTTETTLTTLLQKKSSESEEKRQELLGTTELEEMFLKLDKSNIDGRNLELFFPILILARALSSEIFDEILEIGKAMMVHKKEEEIAESVDAALYDYIAHKESTMEYHSIKDLLGGFKIWYGDNEWLNDRWFGRALKRLNLVVDKRRVPSGMMVLLNVAKAKEKVKIFKTQEEKEDDTTRKET